MSKPFRNERLVAIGLPLDGIRLNARFLSPNAWRG
jgi:hypothetical protein